MTDFFSPSTKQGHVPDWGGVAEILRKDDVGVGRIKGWSTRTRGGLLLIATLFPSVFWLLAGRRGNWAELATLRGWAEGAFLVVFTVVAVAWAVRPPHKAPLASAVVALGGLSGLAGAVLWASWAPFYAPAPMVPLLRHAGACFALGVLSAAPVFVMASLFDRGARRLWGGGVFAAALFFAASLSSLFIHCPFTAPSHLWAGHLTVLLPALALALLSRARRSI